MFLHESVDSEFPLTMTLWPYFNVGGICLFRKMLLHVHIALGEPKAT